jgi:hypothetical protein
MSTPRREWRVDCAPRWCLARRKPMLDLILVAGALAFFAVTIGYAYACDQL